MDIEEDLLNNKEQSYNHVNYKISNMSLCLDIGKRMRQEDSGLIMTHPLNNDIKLMAVADGLGGLSDGNAASHIAILTLYKWFIGLDSNVINNEKNVISEMFNAINQVDVNIINKYRDCSGTTLLAALILKNNTFVFSIGDSKIMLLNDKNIIYENKLDTYAWDSYYTKKDVDINSIKFHKNNNILTDYIGYFRMININYGIKSFTNSTYDKIILLTDGICDYIGNDEILKKDLSSEDFVNNVKNKKIINDFCLDDNHYSEIIGGYDNMTAAVLKKRF